MIRRPGLTERLSVGAAAATGTTASRPPTSGAAMCARRGTVWGSFLETEGRERERGRVWSILHERHRAERQVEPPGVAAGGGGAEPASHAQASRRRDGGRRRDVELGARRHAEGSARDR